MKDYISLPAVYFSDDEMLGARVRLLVPIKLSHGHYLKRGESFVVMDVVPGDRRSRQFAVTNPRAKGIPVRASAFEVLLAWPTRVQGT